jgi:hypothetical protein
MPISGPIGWLRKKVLIPLLYNRADRVTVTATSCRLVEGFGVPATRLLTINNFFRVAQV